MYDLDAAVDRAIDGICDNAGQVCNAGSRLLVQRSIHDAFLSRFAARTVALYRPGNTLDPGTTLGPVVSTAQQCQVLARIAQATWLRPCSATRLPQWRSTAKRCSARSPA